MPESASEIRYLSARSLALRWDCSRSKVYELLAEMRKMGVYAGIRIGADQRVALHAVEAFESCLARDERPTARGALVASRLATSDRKSVV